ncbi:hypothetical protein THRCLA_05578 [Thraustotheca clavata]|uniref:Tubulin polyglutamylase n=1 Tax=Thraustotheca clavata TaxID=74557 RepID=A0A1V9ZVJ8_9STRA|nr:hypothetical protein THRCLA_05578 [Thraustotheca clavata]
MSKSTKSKEKKEIGPIKSKRKVVVDVSLCRYAIIKRCLKARDFRLVREKNTNAEWDIWWSDRGELLKDTRRLHPFQKLNHFPSMEDICRKDFLANHLNAMRKCLPTEYDFFPRSFLMPAERLDLQTTMDNDTRNATYIIKPRTLCQGKGIKLVQSFTRVPLTEPCVVQKYIHNPLLIDGYKFDLRIYVLVYSVDPLQVYIFRNGLARLCTTPFERPTKKNLNQTRMHLTNYAINKKAKEFEKSNEESKGSKRSLAFVMSYLQSQQLDANAVWADICGIIIKTLLAIQPRLQSSYRNFFGNDATNGRSEWGPACFEILGFDIMLDDKGKCWLFEVNHAPSFAGEAKLDKDIKTPLIEQALDILNVTNRRKRAFLARNRKAWKERLWNVVIQTKGPSESTTQEITKTKEVPEINEQDNNEQDNNEQDNNDQDDDEIEADTEAIAEKIDPSPRSTKTNRIHPTNQIEIESKIFSNVYELIYPSPNTTLQAKYTQILSAAETNRSKLWG